MKGKNATVGLHAAIRCVKQFTHSACCNTRGSACTEPDPVISTAITSCTAATELSYHVQALSNCKAVAEGLQRVAAYPCCCSALRQPCGMPAPPAGQPPIPADCSIAYSDPAATPTPVALAIEDIQAAANEPAAGPAGVKPSRGSAMGASTTTAATPTAANPRACRGKGEDVGQRMATARVVSMHAGTSPSACTHRSGHDVGRARRRTDAKTVRAGLPGRCVHWGRYEGRSALRHKMYSARV